jgi:hypothetical protein
MPDHFFTVVGFWPDTNQRFACSYQASDAGMAEALCGKAHPGIAIVAVFEGDLTPVDQTPTVTYT